MSRECEGKHRLLTMTDVVRCHDGSDDGGDGDDDVKVLVMIMNHDASPACYECAERWD